MVDYLMPGQSIITPTLACVMISFTNGDRRCAFLPVNTIVAEGPQLTGEAP